MPADIFPESLELGMGEVGGAEELVVVVSSRKVDANLRALLDPIPVEVGVIIPEDRSPPFGVAADNVVGGGRPGDLVEPLFHPGDVGRSVLSPELLKLRVSLPLIDRLIA